MSVSRYLCFVIGENPDRIRRCHASTRSRTTAYGIALHIPVLIWAVTGYLIASQLFAMSPGASAAVAFGTATLVYLVERVVIASPRGWLLNVARFSISIVAATLGASAVDLTIFQREVEQQLRVDREREITERFDQLAAQQRSDIERRKADWSDAQGAAACEADGTCGSRVRSTGPVYRQLARHAELLRNDYLNAVKRLEALEVQRGAEMQRAATGGEVLRDAGLLARLDALHRYTLTHDIALLAWALFFGLVMLLELLVLIIKLGFGDTVDDRIERMRERATEHRAKEYLDAVTSPMRQVQAFLNDA
jgi:hypothetical protein